LWQDPSVRVLCLDVDLHNPATTTASFSSTTSVFEYDVVIWDPVNTYIDYTHETEAWLRTTYQGLPSLNLDKSTRFEADVERRRAEFEELLSLGRTLVVFTPPPQELILDTGKRETSGTGRNQKVTNLVVKRDLLHALPYEHATIPAEGTSITARDPSFGALVRRHRNSWYYRAILDSFPGQAIAVVGGTEKVVASLCRTESGGLIVQLPDFAEELDETAEETKGIAQENELDLSHDLLAWLSDLQSNDDDAPEWLGELVFVEEQPHILRLQELESQVAQLTEEISALQRSQALDRRWLSLASGSGAKLEARVAEAFELLGFELDEPVAGRRDIRMTADGVPAVVEVKGVTKSSAEAHVMQLEKWVAEAYLERGQRHKGVLVVNGWREASPSARTDAVFPPQMLPAATSREHCLMTGLQLLAMVRAVLAGRTDEASLRSQIMSTVGVLDGWDSMDDVFVEQSQRPSTE
jgi:hypothetical protein